MMEEEDKNAGRRFSDDFPAFWACMKTQIDLVFWGVQDESAQSFGDDPDF